MSDERPTHVIVDGWDLNNVEDSGLVLRFISITGWHEGPSTFVEQEQRIGHGQFAQPGRRGGRTPTIKGEITATDRALVADAIDRLNALLADGRFGRFEFVDRTQGSRWATAQLLAAPQVDWSGGPIAFYQLQLLVPGAYKFGDTSSDSTPFGMAPVGAGLVYPLHGGGALDYGPQGTTGSVTITNAGSASSTVKFTVEGPTPIGGFEIIDTSTGKRITFLGSVPADSQLVLDGATGTVVIDGTADRLGDTVVEAWPQIPTGGSRDFLFTPLGGTTAAVLTAETTATYW